MDELAPNNYEEDVLRSATPTLMPEQVKIGYLRAWRKRNGGRAATPLDLPGLFTAMGEQ